MNKKYIAGGLLFWAGLSGYMGLRILESYTEDAVFAALSAVPAQAEEIRYSFLSNTLRLKGVEYELPDKSIMHKGTIESVEVTGFNRKCMFVKPNMPAYDPDALPIVAESITVTGITDKIHVDNTQMEQKIADVRIQGWYQRLGMLLDQRSRHAGEASYYEELFRVRLDGLEVNGLSSVVSDPDLNVPVKFSADKIALASAITPPRGEAKVSPMSLYVSGVRFNGETVLGSMQRMDVKDLILPAPEAMAALVSITRDREAEPDEASDTDEAVYMTDEEKLDSLVQLLQKSYEHRLPYTLFGMQGGNIVLKGMPESVMFSLNGLACTQSMVDKDTVKSGTDLSGLRVKLPSKGDKTFTIIDRYAPEGLTLNMKAETLNGSDEVSSTARYELAGLGELEGEVAFSGDFDAVNDLVFHSSEVSPVDILQKIPLKKMLFHYKDSGLLPMIFELAAWYDFERPEDYLTVVFETAETLKQKPDKLFRDLGAMIEEQFTAPGEVRLSFTPEKPLSIMDLVNMLIILPGSVPLTVESTPGTKPLADYLPQKAKEPAADVATPAAPEKVEP